MVKRLIFEGSVYKMCDKIIHMKCHHRYFEQRRYDRYRKKMFIADFPMFIMRKNGNKKISLNKP